MDCDRCIEWKGEIDGFGLDIWSKFSYMERIDYTIDTRRRMPLFSTFPVR